MARKRMIDPKFWTDDKIIELKRETRLLFIGMWNFSNDYGIHIDNDKVLKAEIYPVDEDIAIETINFMKNELIEFNLIELGYCENTKISLIKIKNWTLYQKISKPQPSKYLYITGMVGESSETVPKPFPSNKIEYNKIKQNKIKDIVQKSETTSGPKPYKDRVIEYFDNINKDQEFLNQLKEAYPNVNINKELINSKMWLLTNTHKAKKYFKRFINGWMSRQMEYGSNYSNTSEEVTLEIQETKRKKEQIIRKKEEQEAFETAASSEESSKIMKDALKDLRQRRKERIENVTDIKSKESKNPRT